MKRIVFRADASLEAGSGHVMRSLALAQAWRARGAECSFVCRAHPGHLLEAIRARGFRAFALAPGEAASAGQTEDGLPVHAGWLGARWQDDAAQTAAIVRAEGGHWLVVDHYGLDARWEGEVQAAGAKLMAIDDLADRAHVCEVLLDQNLGRTAAAYADLVPPACRVLTGPAYALLRPEFAAARAASLARRADPRLERILVTMGGVDLGNASGQVLQALAGCDLAPASRITLVMGAKAPALAQVRAAAAALPWPVEVVVDVADMAARMATCDLAIGAAGGSAWERCTLGVPTLMVVLADNQRPGARALHESGAAWLLGEPETLAATLAPALARLAAPGALAAMSQAARRVSDGRGCESVVDAMEACDA